MNDLMERREQRVAEIEEILGRDRERKRIQAVMKRDYKGEIKEAARQAAKKQAVSEFLHAALEERLERAHLPAGSKVTGWFDHISEVPEDTALYLTGIDGIYGTFFDSSFGISVHKLKLSSNPILIQAKDNSLQFYEMIGKSGIRDLREITFSAGQEDIVDDSCSQGSREYGLNAKQVQQFLKRLGIKEVLTDYKLGTYYYYPDGSCTPTRQIGKAFYSGKIRHAHFPIQERADTLFQDAYASLIEKKLAEYDADSNKAYWEMDGKLIGIKSFREEAQNRVVYREIENRLAQALGVIAREKGHHPEDELPIDRNCEYDRLTFMSGIDSYIYEEFRYDANHVLRRNKRETVNSQPTCRITGINVKDEKTAVVYVRFEDNTRPSDRLTYGGFGQSGYLTYSLKDGRITGYDVEKKGTDIGIQMFDSDVADFVKRINAGGPRGA